jgi:hypothetical protein
MSESREFFFPIGFSQESTERTRNSRISELQNWCPLLKGQFLFPEFLCR